MNEGGIERPGDIPASPIDGKDTKPLLRKFHRWTLPLNLTPRRLQRSTPLSHVTQQMCAAGSILCLNEGT